MKSNTEKPIESLLEAYVLSRFSLPAGAIIWCGSSELGSEDFTYYFNIANKSYVLVNQPRRASGDVMLADVLIGNAVAPHERVSVISPIDGLVSYVSLSIEESRLSPWLVGDFTLFEVLHG